MSEITASEQIRLDIIKKVNYDTAAAKLAIDWVGDSKLKAELFADSFDRVFTESEIVSKTRKAIQEATAAFSFSSFKEMHYACFDSPSLPEARMFRHNHRPLRLL